MEVGSHRKEPGLGAPHLSVVISVFLYVHVWWNHGLFSLSVICWPIPLIVTAIWPGWGSGWGRRELSVEIHAAWNPFSWRIFQSKMWMSRTSPVMVRKSSVIWHLWSCWEGSSLPSSAAQETFWLGAGKGSYLELKIIVLYQWNIFILDFQFLNFCHLHLNINMNLL